MRRKPRPQKTKSNTTAAAAMAPSNAGSPRRPITAASAKPSSGVDMWASVIGRASRTTAAWVTAARLGAVGVGVIGGSGGGDRRDLPDGTPVAYGFRRGARWSRARSEADA